jgi:sugar phosphate isomerase/epimerase
MLLPSGGARKPKLTLEDLPAYTFDVLGLSGLNLTTDLLVGADRAKLEGVRERADKAACAVLLLVESEPQAFGNPDEATSKAATARLTRVVEAARFLGCNAVAVKVVAEDNELSLLRVSARMRPAVDRAEKLDLSILISPHTGLTSTPERVTELIKRIGGFRIGTFPDFEAATKQPDPVGYLRRLCPYASAVSASTIKFKPSKNAKGELDPPMDHEPYDLNTLVKAVSSVGYDGALAIDYRGTGDISAGVRASRNALLKCLATEEDDIDEELDDDFADLIEDTDEPLGAPGDEE